MTIQTAIYRVKEALRLTSDDASIPDRFIFEELKSVRNELMKQELNKKRQWGGSFAQNYANMGYTLVPEMECGCSRSSSTILRTKDKVPDILETDFGLAIIAFTSASGTDIPLYTPNRARSIFNMRGYTPSIAGVFKNDYIYIYNYDSDAFCSDLLAHFKDFEQVSFETYDCLTKCKPIYELEFEATPDIERRIILMVKETIAASLGIPQDRENNAKEDLAGIPNMQPTRTRR